MEAIIELKDIKKAYGQTEVLNHFNLSIDQGEFITIIGTSGSGKTTVLKMINGLIQPTSGHVKVHGQDIQEQDLIQLRRHQWLETVQLDTSFKDKYPHTLSGGQQQRVGIARALANQPDILLMDEPFGAVDEITRRQLQDELLKIYQQKKITILFVTHDIQEALKLGTKVLIMDQGQIQQFDTPENIIKYPANNFVKKLVSKNES